MSIGGVTNGSASFSFKISYVPPLTPLVQSFFLASGVVTVTTAENWHRLEKPVPAVREQ